MKGINMLIGEKFDYQVVACQYSLKNYILFRCKLPYQNLLDMDIYKATREFELSERLNLPKRTRQVVYALSRNCIKDQAIPSKGTLFTYNVTEEKYSFFTSDIDILIECFEEEDDIILKLYDEESEHHDLSILVQTTLSFFAHKYNEVIGGSDFFIPFAEECGALQSYYIVNNVVNEIYKLKKGLIISGITLINKPAHKNDNLHDEIDRPFQIWKYYFNKAKHSYYVYDNLDCILSTAISLESYLNYLIDLKCLREQYEYARKQAERKKQSAKGFYFTLKFLGEKRIISKHQKDKIAKVYSDISGFRNNIVHGNIYSPIQDRVNAKIAYDAILDLYNTIEGIEKGDAKVFYPSNEVNYNKANVLFKKAEEYIAQKQYEQAKQTYIEIMKDGFFNMYCIFKLGRCHKELGEYEEAEAYFTKCIEESYCIMNALYLRAECKFFRQKYEDALLDYRELIKKDPKEESNYKIVGDIHIKLDQYEEAIRSYKQLLTISKSEGAYFACLGYAYNCNNQREQALQILAEGLSLYPNHKEILWIRCKVYIDYFIHEKKYKTETLQNIKVQIEEGENGDYYKQIYELIKTL